MLQEQNKKRQELNVTPIIAISDSYRKSKGENLLRMDGLRIPKIAFLYILKGTRDVRRPRKRLAFWSRLWWCYKKLFSIVYVNKKSNRSSSIYPCLSLFPSILQSFFFILFLSSSFLLTYSLKTSFTVIINSVTISSRVIGLIFLKKFAAR